MKLSYCAAFILGIIFKSTAVFSYSQSETETCCQIYYGRSFDIAFKNNQIYRLKSNLRNQENNIQNNQDQIQRNNEEIAYLADDNQHLKSSNEDMKESISKKIQQLAKLTGYLDRYRNDYDDNREDISNLLEKIDQEKQKLSRFRAETKRQSVEIQDLIKRNVVLKTKHIDRNQQIVDKLKAEYQILDPKNSDNLSDASSSNNQNINHYRSQIRYYESNIIQVQTEIDSIVEEKENCNQNQESLHKNYEKVKKDYEDCQQNLIHTKKYEDVQAAQSFLNDECRKITDKLNEEHSINMNLYYSIKDKLDRNAEDRLEFC